MWFRTGTISLTNGSTTVTGSGTTWIANAGVGEALYAPDGRLYEIASISSDTSMTLASAYLGTTASGQTYVIVPSQSYIRDLAAQAADLVNNYATIYNTVGQGKFPDGTLAAPAVRFSDDLDTGFYRSAANEVTFVAGGVAQFKYNTSGLVMSSSAAGIVNLTTTGNTTLGDAAADTVTINGTPTINAPTAIVTNSATNALRITQTGAGNALLVEDAANPDATPFVVDNAGRLLSGQLTGYATFNDYLNTARTPQFQFSGTSTPATMFSLANWSALASSPATLNLAKSRGASVGTQAVVVSGDDIGVLEFSADDGTNFVPAAAIIAEVDGTPGTGDMPGRLVFSTTADGASSPTEAMRIDSGQRIGIFGAPSTNRRIQVSGATAPAASGFSFGLSLQQTIQSDLAGGLYNGFSTTPATAAAAFNLGTLNHFNATQGTFGATSSVVNQYGFVAAGSLTGATNNYGFYSNIASGTGRWNFYAAGSAENYFGGATTISANSTSDALRITQTGTGNALVVEDAANPDSTPFVITANGTARVGTLVGIGLPSVDSNLEVNEQVGRAVTLGRSSADASAAALYFAKSRSATYGSRSIVASGDIVGGINFFADDGTQLLNSAFIRAEVDGTPGLNDMPGRLVFSTTADGAASPTERMRIDSAGRVGIGGAAEVGVTFQLAKTMTGGTTVKSTVQNGIVQSDATAGAWYNQTYVQTAAAAFTLPFIEHYGATQGPFGVGSTVTAQRGFHAFSTLTGATNNYGFYSNIASGTGRWNFYAAGSAANYFAGETQVVSGFTIGRTAVTAPAASDGNVFSGTYTPTLTNTLNVTSSTAVACQYMRVGNVVTVSGQVTITSTAAGNTELGISIPIASNLAAGWQAVGTGRDTAAAGTIAAAIIGDVTNDRLALRYVAASGVATTFSFTTTYLVV